MKKATILGKLGEENRNCKLLFFSLDNPEKLHMEEDVGVGRMHALRKKQID